MSLSNRIIELRTQRGLSQNQLSKLMGVTRQAVSKWENGLSTPDPGKLILLAEVLNTSLEYLATGKIPESSPAPEAPSVIERVVEVPVVEFVDRIQIKRVVRKQYRRNPLEYLMTAILSFLIGLAIGILFT